MKAKRSSFAFAALALATIGIAQPSEVDVDDLFNDDFETAPTATINDPLHHINRVVFRFNDQVYTDVAKPFARFYRKTIPVPVQTGINNVFNNVKFPSRFVGSVLQGKFKRAGQETGKFVINSTIGIGGIFNATKNMDGLNPPEEDIGQAFAKWGIGHGFFVVLPFIGPTSLRDFVGNYADNAVEPVPTPMSMIENKGLRLTLRVVDNVNELPFILDLYDSMRRTAIDPYTAVRDAYAQQRAKALAE